MVTTENSFVRKPNFFIVGAPKCGTTALYFYLKQHPEIFLPQMKEPHFFGSDLKSPRFIRDKEKYLSLFSEVKDEKRVGEASPWYLYSKLAAAEMKEFCPDARIIIMLREPAEMLYSVYSQQLFNGNEDITDFETALNAEDDRKQGLRIPRNMFMVEGLFYREIVKYTQQVKRYLDAFGRVNVHIIIYDDFKNETTRVYRETLCFLDVDEDFKPEFSIINPNRSIRSRTLRNFLQNPPLIAQWFNKALVPDSLRQRLADKLNLLNTKYEPRPPMDFELRKCLQAEFAPEVERLSQLIGRDLTSWSKQMNQENRAEGQPRFIGR